MRHPVGGLHPPIRLGNCRTRTLRGDDGLPIVSSAAQQQRELVAAHSERDVRAARRSLEGAGHMTEDFVSRGVAAGVVDELEAVEVDEHEAEPASVSPGPLDLPRDVLMQLAPVEQSGERVAGGEPLLSLEETRVDERDRGLDRVGTKQVDVSRQERTPLRRECDERAQHPAPIGERRRADRAQRHRLLERHRCQLADQAHVVDQHGLGEPASGSVQPPFEPEIVDAGRPEEPRQR